MEIQNIKQQIDSYCNYNMLDIPKDWDEYIHYADRFLRIALISEEDYSHFVMYATDEKQQGHNVNANLF